MVNETITDSNGQGTILGLMNGQNLSLNISKNGYSDYSDTVTVNKDNLNMNIIMENEPTIELTYDASINRTFLTWDNTPFTFTGEYTVNYGDGTIETVNENKQLTHTYEDDKIYIIKINGNITETYRSFDGLNGLIKVRINNNITNLNNMTFNNCSNLSEAYIGNSVTYLDYGCFKGSGISNIILSDNLNTIGQSCFDTCSNLSSINIPTSVTTLGKHCFDKSGLITITIPSNIETIPQHCFSDCANLTTINISNGVKNIGNYCFNNCTALTSISIPSSIISFGRFMWEGCGTALIDIQLYWTENVLGGLPNNENTIYTIPNGTSQLYIDAGYPAEKLVERGN